VKGRPRLDFLFDLSLFPGARFLFFIGFIGCIGLLHSKRVVQGKG
jgi:hypothetical protein